ncbi:MAG: M14 family zinc carboxypeptidase [candidate division Zixibacteria bacterium]
MRFSKLILPLLFSLLFFSVSQAQLPDRYTTYGEAFEILSDLQSSHPEICRLDTMGYSTRDGIPMLRFKISDNAAIDEDEPAIFYCGGVHADEVLSVEVIVNFVEDFFARYDNGDMEINRYINSMELFCIPFINPEGHTAVEEGNTVWRKNKCDNDENGIFDYHDGVDNNRNYDFGWYVDDGIGANTPESLMFKGYAPFTQTENIAMADFAWSYRPLIALDYHSPTYGRPNVAYYPWYWYSSDGGHGFGPDEDMMQSICASFTSLIEAIPDDSGNGTYTARRALVNKGDFKTYFYGNFGSVSFSVEVSDTTIQDPALVDSIVAAHLPGQYYLLDRALGAGITGVIRDSVTMEPLEAEVQVTQHMNADINPRLSRPDYGRYRRILAPGTYTLKFLKDDYATRTLYNVSVTNSGPTVNDVYLVPLNPLPPAPYLSYPPVDTTLSYNMIDFIWRHSLYADHYLFELSYDSLFSEMVHFDSTVSDSTLSFDIPLADSLYYWRIKGGNDNGWGPYSATSAFTIELTTGIDGKLIHPDLFGLSQNYPNPFNATTRISFKLSNSSDVRLDIYNLLGQRVATLYEGVKDAGEHSVAWNADDHPSGVYFARLETADRSESIRMVLLK